VTTETFSPLASRRSEEFVSRTSNRFAPKNPRRRGQIADRAADRWNDEVGDETQQTTEGIEVRFDLDEGHVHLDCDEEEFVYIRDLVLYGAKADGLIGPVGGGIQSIAIRCQGAVRDTAPAEFCRGSLRLLIILGVLLSVALQFIGIFAAVRWLMGVGS
jgi:hypothetical protein